MATHKKNFYKDQRWTLKRCCFYVLPGINPGYSRLPQSKKIIMYNEWANCLHVKNWENSSNAPGQRVPSRVLCWPSVSRSHDRCWVRTRPPSAVWAWVAYSKPAFWVKPSDTETLSHGLVISTPGSHSSTSTLTSPLPSATIDPQFRVSVISFYPWCFSSGGLHFAFFTQTKSCFSALLFFSKYAVWVALLFSPLAPRLAASTSASLEGQSDSPLALSF